MKIDCIKELWEGDSSVIFDGIYNVTLPVRVKRFKLTDVEVTLQEEEALRKLKHQNVVKLLDAESDKDFRYLV